MKGTLHKIALIVFRVAGCDASQNEKPRGFTRGAFAWSEGGSSSELVRQSDRDRLQLAVD